MQSRFLDAISPVPRKFNLCSFTLQASLRSPPALSPHFCRGIPAIKNGCTGHKKQMAMRQGQFDSMRRKAFSACGKCEGAAANLTDRSMTLEGRCNKSHSWGACGVFCCGVESFVRTIRSMEPPNTVELFASHAIRAS